MQSSPHNQFTFRPLPPPPPPPHACTCARKPPPTVDSLQRRSMTTRSQPSPAAPAPPTSTQDSVHLHNSWVLNSNIPLETRYLSYFSFLLVASCTVCLLYTEGSIAFSLILVKVPQYNSPLLSKVGSGKEHESDTLSYPSSTRTLQNLAMLSRLDSDLLNYMLPPWQVQK